ncbi:uncharacterized protein LOC143922599 [Arctopsyche grandis]|uniref:uncharacterized protein LOC143922599 n=1 Tax=Arctopsyche grandis TaxID=121162 RepID=UPI00406D79E8
MYKKFWKFRGKSIVLKEWFCEIFSKAYILNLDKKFDLPKVESLVKDVDSAMPKSEYGRIALVVLMLVNGKQYDAYKSTCDILRVNKRNRLVKMLRAICCIELGRFCEAEKAMEAFVDDPDINTAVSAKRIMLIAKSSQLDKTKCLEGIKMYDDLDSWCTGEKEDIGMFHAYMYLEMYEKAEYYLEMLANSPVHSSLHVKLLVNTGKRDEAVNVMVHKKNNRLCKIQLSAYYLSIKEYQSSLRSLLELTTADSNNHEVFLHLGDFYTFSGKSFESAKRCYIKAFELNPECSIAGKNLSRTYIDLKEWYPNSVFLQSLIDQSADFAHDLHWPWMHLGIHYAAMGHWDIAIRNYCTYLRLCPLDSDGWEAIAEAYYQRGSYTTAMRWYKKALHLNPLNTFCIVQIGSIQCLLGYYRDALATFATVEDKTYLPAIRGLGEVKICVANEMLSKNLFGLCRDNAQEAIDLVSPAILQHTKLTCLKKILCDAIKVISKLPPKFNWLKYSSGEEASLKLYKGNDILKLAISSIASIEQVPFEDDCYFNHELAAAHLSLYDHSGIIANLKSSFESIIKCLEINKTRWQHWNLFGVICMAKDIDKRHYAQHAFVKGLQLDPGNAMIWSNLGVLYLIAGMRDMADKAFTRAQETDPSYMQGWIGKALNAEPVGHNVAMDLFRHSGQLGFNESSFGYTHWLASTKNKPNGDGSSTSKMLAVAGSADLMEWYDESKAKTSSSSSSSSPSCSSSPSSSSSPPSSSSSSSRRIKKSKRSKKSRQNVQGLMSEKIECISDTLKVFREALNCVTTSGRNEVLYNLGKIHSNKGITWVNNADEAFLYPMAMNHYECGEYQKAYDIYRKIFLSTKDKTKKLNVLIAMAKVAFKSNDYEKAQEILVQCCQESDDTFTVNAVLALSASYLLQCDMDKAQTPTWEQTDNWDQITPCKQTRMHSDSSEDAIQAMLDINSQYSNTLHKES